MSVRLGATTAVPGATGQYRVALVFTNSGDEPCTLRGVPSVELRGPSDPNGPVYQLQQAPASPVTVVLAVGGTAQAPLTYLTSSAGDTGSLGSTNWIPTQVVITPPGDAGQLTVAWTSHEPVLRQDEATHPGTYVGPVRSG